MRGLIKKCTRWRKLTHTERQTDGHGDSMTNSAQWGRVGENNGDHNKFCQKHVLPITFFSKHNFSQKFYKILVMMHLTNPNNIFFFHQLGPTGPSWSVSRHVRLSVCLSVCLRHPAPQGARLLVKVEGGNLETR